MWPPPLLAETDTGQWAAFAGALVAVLTAIGTGVGVALRMLFSYLKERDAAIQLHIDKVMDRVETIAREFNETTKEQRAESRQTMSAVMEIQGKTVGAVTEVSLKLQNLTAEVASLKSFVGRKERGGGTQQ